MHGRTRAQLDEAMRVHGVAHSADRSRPSNWHRFNLILPGFQSGTRH